MQSVASSGSQQHGEATFESTAQGLERAKADRENHHVARITGNVLPQHTLLNSAAHPISSPLLRGAYPACPSLVGSFLCFCLYANSWQAHSSMRQHGTHQSCPRVIERLQLLCIRHQDPARVRCLAERSERQGGTTSVVARLRKASLGNLGDVKPVGKGVVEMREHFGPGWRMYFTLRGTQLVVMLGGGAKSSQRTDIIAAQRRAAVIEDK